MKLNPVEQSKFEKYIKDIKEKQGFCRATRSFAIDHSTFCNHIEYDETKELIRITTLTGSEIFASAKTEQFEEFLASESKGKHYNKYLKNPNSQASERKIEDKNIDEEYREFENADISIDVDDSSFCTNLAYDKTNKIIRITTTGDREIFVSADIEHFMVLSNSRSKGGYYNIYIKGNSESLIEKVQFDESITEKIYNDPFCTQISFDIERQIIRVSKEGKQDIFIDADEDIFDNFCDSEDKETFYNNYLR